MLGDSTVRNDVRGGRRNIRAGQEEAHCRPISYKEREKIWNDAVARETATRKPGCQNGAIGKAALAVLQEPAFRFHQHEDRRLLSAREDAAGEATALVQPRQLSSVPSIASRPLASLYAFTGA